MKLAFTKKEYLQRVKKVRREMRTRKVDILIATDPGNMNWLTGYDGWSFYVHQGAVIHVDHEEPIWFGRRMDENAALLRCFMKKENLISYPEEYVQNLEKHPMSWLAEHIFVEKGWAGATIATEMDNYYYTADAHRSLRLGLPEARFVDSYNLVNWCRAIKSDKEIEFMKIAGKITSKIHQRILDVARVGVPKSHVVSQIYETAIAGVDGTVVTIRPSYRCCHRGKKLRPHTLRGTSGRSRPMKARFLKFQGAISAITRPCPVPSTWASPVSAF